MTEIHNFKKYMEEIKRERPHLAVGAQRQMALQRCSSDSSCNKSINVNKDVEEHQHEKGKNLLSTLMSKMAFAKKQLSNGRRSRSDSSSDEEDDWSKKYGGGQLQTQDSDSSILLARGTVISDMREPSIRKLSRQDSLEAIERSVFETSPPCSNYRRSCGSCGGTDDRDRGSMLTSDAVKEGDEDDVYSKSSDDSTR
mmetsp:Transcript_21403/g.34797  ORF Transcript_21403/g.34797 Transcript_21403/m.34797 type:complete len:197 (+) Transcript_21403:109-699(+)